MEALGAIPVPLIRGGAVLLDGGAGGEAARRGEKNEADDRPIVVLIHGLGFWSFVWTRLADTLLATGRCKAVLTYDRYGRGFSDVATDQTSGRTVPHSPALFAQQLDELLLAVRLRGGRPARAEALCLAGASMGGAIATAYAAAPPPDVAVRRLVLMAPAALRAPAPMANLGTRLSTLPLLGPCLYGLFGAGAQRRMMAERKFADDVPGLETDDPALLADLSACMTWQLDTKPDYVWDLYRDVVGMPWNGLQAEAAAVGAAGLPVQLVWGEVDAVVPPAYAELWTSKVPGAAIATLPGAAHSPYLQPANLPALADLILPPPSTTA
eukprot:jgi/Tetstr1/450228/TSEL_037266.t1